MRIYLGATDSDVDGDLFVTSDTEGSDGVTGLALRDSVRWNCIAMFENRSKLTVDGGLTRKLLQHLGGTGKSVTRLSDGDVQNELLNLQLPHGVVCLFGSHGCCY